MSIKSKIVTAVKFAAGAAVLGGVAYAAFYFLTQDDQPEITASDIDAEPANDASASAGEATAA